MKGFLQGILMVASLWMAASAQADVNPGQWQWSMTMSMQGMDVAMPPQTFDSCITKENLVPKDQEENKNCTVVENSIDGGNVHWIIECNSDAGAARSEGNITYMGDTAAGEINSSAMGMNMTAKVTGKRVGPCR